MQNEFSILNRAFRLSPTRRLVAAGCLLALLALGVWLGPWRRSILVYHGKTVEGWSLSVFAGEPSSSQAKAALTAMGSEAVPDLVRLLQAKDPLLRKETQALARRIPPAVTRVVLPQVNRPAAAALRKAAARALGIIGPSATNAVPALVRALWHRDEGLNWEAAGALGHIGRESVPGLMKALSDTNPKVRRPAVYGLGEVGPDAAPAVPALIHAFHDSDPGIRSTSGASLPKIGLPAVAGLLEIVANEHGAVRDAAAQIVEQIYAPGVLRVESQRPEVQPSRPSTLGPQLSRVAAVANLAGTEEPDSVLLNVWAAVLRDPDAAVRLAAVKGLCGIGEKAQPAMAALARCLGDESAPVREWAARSLGNIGEPAKPALRVLGNLERDPDESVRAAAREATERLKATR